VFCAAFVVETEVTADAAFRADAVFDAFEFEEEPFRTHVYPIGQLAGIGVQVYPAGQATCACVFAGTTNATANDKTAIGIAR
jgi:hypothetical protein